MRQPQGFINKDKPNHVCLLKRALYGLHQSAHEWFYEIEIVLQVLGFEKFSWTNCVYVYKKNIILLLYVDNIILLGHNEIEISKTTNKLNEKIDLKILRKNKKLLGVHF